MLMVGPLAWGQAPAEPAEPGAGAAPPEEAAQPAPQPTASEEPAQAPAALNAPEDGGEAAPEAPAEGLPVEGEQPAGEQPPQGADEAVEELPPAASEREADVEGALKALTEEARQPTVAPTRGAPRKGKPSRRDRLTRNLDRWARMWRGEVTARASKVAERRSKLEAQNAYLKRTARRLPRDVRKGKTRVEDARAYSNDFQRWIAAYDRLFDLVQEDAAAAPGRAAAYRRKLDLAKQVKAKPDTVKSFEDCVRLAERIEADLSAMSALVMANADLCAQILNELDSAIDEAEHRALRRRSDVRVTPATFTTLGRDVRTLLAWIGGQAQGRLTATDAERMETSKGPGAVEVIGRAVGILIVGALLVFIGRRFRKRLRSYVESLLEPTAEEERDRALWRYRLVVNIARTILIFVFALSALHLLELPGPWLASLIGVAAAWCGYYVAHELLRLALSPREADYRLVECNDEGAVRLFRSANVLLIVSAVFLPLLGAFRAFRYAHADVALLAKIVYGLCFIAVLGWLTYVNSRRPILQLDGRSHVGRSLHRWLRVGLPVGCALAVGALILLAPGYANLSTYLARGLALTALVCGLAAAAQEWIRPRLTERYPLTGTRDDPTATAHLVIHYAERVGLLVVVWLVLMSVWGVRAHHIEALIAFLGAPLLSIKGTKISISGLVKGALVIFGSYAVARYVRARVERSRKLADTWYEGSRYATGALLYYGILTVGVVVGILVAGLQLNVLVAFGGMVGIAVGFGSQDIAKNIICGLIILLDRSINVGDFVDVAGKQGTIEGISVRCTTVRTPENRLLVVPNSTFYTQNIVISSQRDRQVRLQVDVVVAADTDMETVREALIEVARSQESILSEPEPEVLLTKLAANALNLQLTAWTDHLGDPTQNQNALVTAIWQALREREIAMM